MEILRTKTFQKAYDKLAENPKTKVDDALALFLADRTDPALRDHPLKGKMKEFRSFSAAWDLRIIYREKGGFITVILMHVGSHNQVY
ncbi:MAG: type II toxin-antitoxin system mRNA interferase toxin, RelE/StbE family [Akkermansiaceae bacterium]|nr:type II toxin-antitoxin system mRNA interferase toxin, RelE/StbE family [Akkermansiaceae bacterium]